MRVNHRRAHVVMPEQFLDRADVVTSLQQVRRKAMTKRVAASGLVNASFPEGIESFV